MCNYLINGLIKSLKITVKASLQFYLQISIYFGVFDEKKADNTSNCLGTKVNRRNHSFEI